MRTRRIALFVLASLTVAACGSDSADDASDVSETAAVDPTSSSAATSDGSDDDSIGDSTNDQIESPATDPADDRVESSPTDVTVSGLDIVRGGSSDGAPEPAVDINEIRSGGPPPDGIPSIDEPTFISIDEVDFLGETEPVLAVDIEGDVRAYPVQILMWHEIVNDTVAGIPVSITYCPLCNSAVAYDRRLDDRVLEFGTSGLLWNSALVMYDRQTETLWSHFTGEGIVGELTGTELDIFPVATVPWGVWRDANPDGLVLSRDTGFNRDYGRNPYPGYDDVNSQPFLFDGEVDGRYTAMTRIAGIEVGDDAVGVPLVHLMEERVVPVSPGGTDLVVFWEPGTASALDASTVSDGDDVGATGAFVPDVDGQKLTFSVDGDAIVDDQTRSTWSILGEAIEGDLSGEMLESIPHVDTFWFAWSAFRPDTAVIDLG